MSLIQSHDQIVTTTALSRNGAELFDRVANKRDRLVVLKNAHPIAVVMNIIEYEEMQRKITELEALAANKKAM